MDRRRQIEDSLQLFSQLSGNLFERLSSSEQLLTLFAEYWRELERWNRKIRLVGDPADFPSRHLADSLMGAELLLRRGEKLSVLDIGSGGGFPGLVLSIALPEYHFSLCEPNSRKAAFLLHLKRKFNLDNLEIIQVYLKGNPQNEGIDERYDAITFRGVSPQEVFPIAENYLKDEGAVIYWGKSVPPAIKTPFDRAESFEYNLDGKNKYAVHLYLKKKLEDF